MTAAHRIKVGAFAVLVMVCFTADARSGWVDRIVEAYRHQTPIETHAGLEADAAIEIQRQVVAALRADYGDVFGYKAGLTSPAARERFNVDAPVLGTLLADMILDNGSRGRRWVRPAWR